MGYFDWKDIAIEEISDLYRRKIAVCEQLTVARLEVRQGAVTQPHSHENEEVIILIKGCWRFFLPSGDVTLGPGQMLSIAPGLVHSSEALEDTLAFDICTAARPDWLAGMDRELHQDPEQFLWAV
jgi:quercetin dioxygenase-like cupin family protein